MPRNPIKDSQRKEFVYIEAQIIWRIRGALDCYSERAWCLQQFEEDIWFFFHAIPCMNTRCSMHCRNDFIKRTPWCRHLNDMQNKFSIRIVYRCASLMYLTKVTKIIANNAAALECMLWRTNVLYQHWKQWRQQTRSRVRLQHINERSTQHQKLQMWYHQHSKSVKHAQAQTNSILKNAFRKCVYVGVNVWYLLSVAKLHSLGVAS